MKIVILSYAFYGYEDSIARAFEQLGCETLCFGYRSSRGGVRSVIYSSLLRPFELDVDSNQKAAYSTEVIAGIRAFRPDAVLVLRGDFYTDTLADAVRALPSRPRMVVWMMDSIRRFPQILRHREQFDRWFVFEPSDIAVLENGYGIEAQYLGLAFDSEYYHPLDTPTRLDLRADLSFVGHVMDPARYQVFGELAKWAANVGVKVKVITGNYRARYWYHRFVNPALWNCFHARYLAHQDINELYNQCAVNLNVHIGQSVEGLNMRFFEVLGSGGLQLVEERRAQSLLGFEPGRDFLSYSGVEDMKEKIRFALDHPAHSTVVAQAGYEKSSDHDFLARGKELLENGLG